MDRSEYVQMRRARYLRQLMEWFEERIEPQVADADAVADFKGLVRAKMNALAVDAIDVMNLAGSEEINGYAIDTTDRLFPNGRRLTATRS